MNQDTLENGSTLRSLRIRQADKVSKFKLKRQWQKIAAEALAMLNDIKTNEINTSEHNIAVFNEIFINIQELTKKIGKIIRIK
jgi:beta-galactosidase beta subunit